MFKKNFWFNNLQASENVELFLLGINVAKLSARDEFDLFLIESFLDITETIDDERDEERDEKVLFFGEFDDNTELSANVVSFLSSNSNTASFS